MAERSTGATNDTSRANRRSPRRTAIFAGAFFVLLLLVSMACLEIGARILDPLGISFYPETARFLDQLIVEEPIGYRLRPGLDAEFHGVRVKINSVGLRDDEIPETKPEGEFRLMMLGDSVVHSIGVEIEDSVPRRVQALANEHAPPGRHYRVLNMGVPSYNTEQELVQLQSIGMGLEPDAVILLFVVNDIEPKTWVLDKRKGFLVDLAQRSYAASLGFVTLRKYYHALSSSSAKLVQTHRYQEGDERWEAVDRSLTEINRMLKEADIPFMVTYFPLREASHEALLTGVAKREGFPIQEIDVWSDPRWSDLDPRDYMNSWSDSHCNPAGCELLATVLYETLMKEGLLR